MEKITSKQSLKLAADMVDQHHKMGNSHVKIARSDISHKIAVSQLGWGTYEVSGMDKHFISEGFLSRGLRRWKFLAVEPLPGNGEKPDSKSHSVNRIQAMFPLATNAMDAHIKFGDDKHRDGKTAQLEDKYIGAQYSLPKFERHLEKWRRGEMLDDETQESHWRALLWHCLNIVEGIERSKGFKDD